ncbi:hypothetical protein C0416_03825 [bacterium]|nr:hypothetical protein [bacterium]
MDQKTEIFSQLLRDLEVQLGSRDLTEMVLLSLVDSIKAFSGKGFNSFCKQYEDFTLMIENTEPKFGIFQYYFGILKNEITKNCSISGNDDWRDYAIEVVDKILASTRRQKKKILENAEKIDVEGKTILIHDHSHTVHDILAHLKAKKKKFKVIIAEQDFEKTHDNIERLHGEGIPFMVVPAYMLSHMYENIDMAFYGALTLKDTMHFVMDPGAQSIVAEFYLEKIPVYMFLGTDKFSLWKSKSRGEIFVHKQTKEHKTKPISYERIKYSHDRVPAKYFDKTITNEGIFTPEELKKLFDEKMKSV